MKAIVLASLFLLSALAPGLSAQKLGQPSNRDGWSKEITWRITVTNGYAPAIHASLMPDGRIDFIGYERPIKAPLFVLQNYRCIWDLTPTPLGQPLPYEVWSDRIDAPLDALEQTVGNIVNRDDLFCSGHTFLADGTLMTAGGLRVAINVVNGSYQKYGLLYAMTYDGSEWQRVPADMQGAPSNLVAAWRWYPTCTRLPDERILVTAGFALVHPTTQPNYSVEVFDPATGTWTVLSEDSESPVEILNSDYTHVFALPAPVGAYDVLMFGEPGYPVLFSTTDDTSRWLLQPDIRPGNVPLPVPSGCNHGASTALLPLRLSDGEWGYTNGSAIQAGGEQGTVANTHADVYDPYVNAWIRQIDITTTRHHPSTVQLPDGRVLVIAGHDDSGTTAVEKALTIDPRRGFAVQEGQASSGVIRGYHTVTLLLPDGRVLVGGGQGAISWSYGNAEKATFQYYYPDYLTRPRPIVRSAPASISFGAPFDIRTAGGPIREVVLIALGSMTHSIDMNQRYVELAILSQSGGTTTVLGPAGPNLAPAGHYMLFALDKDLTPSIAKIVRLQ